MSDVKGINVRYWWVLKSVLVGLAVLAVAYYLFSFASTITADEQKMLDLLAKYNDKTFEFWQGYNGAMWLAFIGIMLACFAGGMAAANLSREDMLPEYGWVITSAIVIIFLILVFDADFFIRWYNGVQMVQSGIMDRPVELTPFPIILFILFVFDGLCFLASVAGGFIVVYKREMLIS